MICSKKYISECIVIKRISIVGGILEKLIHPETGEVFSRHTDDDGVVTITYWNEGI